MDNDLRWQSIPALLDALTTHIAARHAVQARAVADGLAEALYQIEQDERASLGLTDDPAGNPLWDDYRDIKATWAGQCDERARETAQEVA